MLRTCSGWPYDVSGGGSNRSDVDTVRKLEYCGERSGSASGIKEKPESCE